MLPDKIQRRSLATFEPHAIAPCVTADGSKFYTDANGDMLYAKYSSGAIVSFHHRYVTAHMPCGDYWFVSSAGLSFRID